MKSFFMDLFGNIVEYVENIFKSIQNIDIIFLVGGYSESFLFQEKFKIEFKGKYIIILKDCGFVVMKGVVLYGFNFKFIVVKVLCYLYGIVIFLEFDLDKYLYEK